MVCACYVQGSIKHRIEIVRELVKYGADVDASDAHGDNVLHLCARLSRLALLRVLLKETDAAAAALDTDNFKRDKVIYLFIYLLDGPLDPELCCSLAVGYRAAAAETCDEQRDGGSRYRSAPAGGRPVGQRAAQDADPQESARARGERRPATTSAGVGLGRHGRQGGVCKGPKGRGHGPR